MPTLILQFKGKTIKEYPLQQDRSITIGRKESNDLVISNLGVSGMHARIDSIGDQFTLTDTGSTNGTFVNKNLITTKLLQDGDVILVGKHQIVFSAEESDESGYEEEVTEATLHLDTAEYRELIERAKQEAEQQKNKKGG